MHDISLYPVVLWMAQQCLYSRCTCSVQLYFSLAQILSWLWWFSVWWPGFTSEMQFCFVQEVCSLLTWTQWVFSVSHTHQKLSLSFFLSFLSSSFFFLSFFILLLSFFLFFFSFFLSLPNCDFYFCPINLQFPLIFKYTSYSRFM